MKRSIRLHARAPLRRRTPLRRYTALQAKSAPKQQRVKPAVPADVRDLLALRSGGLCEIGLPGCWIRATDAHHRVNRKMGGRNGEAKLESDRLSSVMHVCRPCHCWVTDNPWEASGQGWTVPEGVDPASVPLVRSGSERLKSIVYLADVGGVYPYEDHGP